MPTPTRRVSARLTLRHGTLAEWEAANPTLLEGEPGFVTDQGKFKVGDGTSDFDTLGDYSNEGAFDHDSSRFPGSVNSVSAALEYLYDHLVAGDLGAHGDEHVFLSTDLITELGELLMTESGDSLQFEEHHEHG